MKIHKLKFQLLLFGLLMINNPIFSQGKFEMSGGFGMPEFIHLKLMYGNKVQVGASTGVIPTFLYYGNPPWAWSVTTQITYHFAGESKYVEQAPWFVFAGLAYYEANGMNFFEYNCNFDKGFFPRIGRTFNFSEKLGINMDFGITLPLNKMPSDWIYSPEPEWKILPSASISLFRRL